MKVMLDTNILVSAIFFPSKVIKKFLDVLSPAHDIVISQYAIDELYKVAEEKFSNKKEKLDIFFNDLPFELLPTKSNNKEVGLPKIRDIKDVPILAAAILENVDILVTGDKDFLVLNIIHPEIMTMSEFVDKYS